MASEPTVYQLKFPIEQQQRVAGGQVNVVAVDTVEIRRLNGADIDFLEQNAGRPGTSMKLIARVTGLNSTLVALLDVEDVAEIGQVIEGFLPPSLRDGGTSSAT
jgi:hypothetical protein